MKKYINFINENYLNNTDKVYDVNDIKKKIENDEIEIDFRTPDTISKNVKEWYKKAFIRNIRKDIKHLPEHLHDYEHPINGELCSFVLYEKDNGDLAITLATIESSHNYDYKEIEIPEKIIEGNYISTELDISSGKLCFLGDNIRDLFPEDDWIIDDYKYSDNFRDVEKDALKHIDYFSKKGYFFTADSFYPTLSKKDDVFHLFETVNFYDDDDIDEAENGKIIKENLNIDSDHTLVIIDNDLLNKKLEKYDNYDEDDPYFKYCIDVEPGKYKIDFNWKREIDYINGDNEGKGILTYCKISKL